MKVIRKFASVMLAIVLAVSVFGCSKTAETVQKQSLEITADWMLEQVPEAACGSIGGEWLVLGLARSDAEVSEEYFETYCENVAAYTAELGGVLHERKYTEYSRVILAMTALGKTPQDVGGYNLLLPLADFEQTVFQGINGAIYALLALDSGNYEIPVNVAESTQATREMYVDYILNAEASTGGWSFTGGEAEIDITAMALQALAKYQERNDVAEAVERALAFLSEQQQENGGYLAYGAESSETLSQVIVALTELGIDMEDSRFVKGGVTLADRLLEFRTEEGSFLHVLDGEADLMATEQAYYALTSLERMEQGKTSLYDMSDVQ